MGEIMEIIWAVAVLVTLFAGNVLVGLLAMFFVVLCVTLITLQKPS